MSTIFKDIDPFLQVPCCLYLQSCPMNDSLTLPAGISAYDFTITLFKYPTWLLRFLDSGFQESDVDDKAAKALIKAAIQLHKIHHPITVNNVADQLKLQHSSVDAINMFVLKVQAVKETDATDAYMLYRCFDEWQRLQAIAVLKDAIEMIDCCGTIVDASVKWTIASLSKLQMRNDSGTSSAAQHQRLLLQALTGKQEQPGHPPVSTGFARLNQYTGSLQSGSLWMIAAKTHTGSTTFALNMARNVLNTENEVLIVSLKHNRQIITNRLLAIECCLPMELLNLQIANETQVQQVYECAKSLALNKCHINDDYYGTPAELLSYLYKAVTTLCTRLVIIDGWEWNHPQNPSAVRKINDDLLSQLSDLAKHYGITVVLTATLHVRRYVDEKEEENTHHLLPLANVCRLHDVYDNYISPRLLQVAITIYRPDYYEVQPSFESNEAMIQLLRNEHGPLASIRLTRQPDCGHWEENMTDDKLFGDLANSKLRF
jgi:replicative DNA helicase